MTNDDRTQLTALLALCAALLGLLWALQSGQGAQAAAMSAGIAYGATAALAIPLQASLGAVLATSAKLTTITVALSACVLIAGAFAAWQLLRGRVPRAVTA
ncbi:hypothetical protein ACJBCE_36860 [Streptomyces sp. NBUL23]|uniref:hypothetical protein n=1 Tax=Streptomyces sp. NBUL23 TaxID=3381354 RepID=UPI00387223CC